MKKRNIIICTLVSLIILLTLILYVYFEVSTLETTYYEVSTEKLPSAFNDFKIAHLTDFHNTKIKKLTNKLIEELKKEKPDIIVITGDLIDDKETEESIDLIKSIASLASIYYVTGNHEASILKTYNDFETKLKEYGVIVLHNEMTDIVINEDKITLLGIDDPNFMSNSSILNESEIMFKSTLRKLTKDLNNYTILLSHRPEFFEDYMSQNIDLTLTGHTHGGQVRLPVIGAFYAPNQGLLPKYNKGLYEKNGKYMIISSGIGTTGLPLRTFNKPELVIIKLKAK